MDQPSKKCGILIIILQITHLFSGLSILTHPDWPGDQVCETCCGHVHGRAQGRRRDRLHRFHYFMQIELIRLK